MFVGSLCIKDTQIEMPFKSRITIRNQETHSARISSISRSRSNILTYI